MRRLSAFGLVVVLLAGALLLPGPALADAQGTTVSDAHQNFTETQFIITVYENGSARYTQRYIQPLSNDTEVNHFHTYAKQFENEKLPVYTDFKERAIALVEEGSNVTGREMHARKFSREARVISQPTPTGVVEMSFLWTNFTTVENGRVVGGVFENGLYLSEEMALTVKAGPKLDIVWTSVEPTPDASTNESGNTTDSFTYFGAQQFASGHPRVAFVPESAVVVGGSPIGTPMVWVGGVLVLALVLGVAVIWRSDSLLSEDDGTTAATVNDTSEETETNEETTPAVPETALETDADRVAALLEANGGRMQQGTIVEETGWSKSKVSMLLTEMEAEDRVSKLRIGRENVVSLAGHEPEATRSRFDDR